jgi:hypothetical protein
MPNGVEETIGIDSSGNTVSFRPQGASEITLVIEGDAAADYAWDVRKRQGSWKKDIGSNYTGSSNYNDQRTTGADEVRIRCSSGTGGSGDEATITLMGN